MNIKDMIEREKYVVIHGQTARFRLVKYLILSVISAGIVLWKGWMVLGQILLVLFVLSLGIHFLFRWKTKAWTESWGPYKRLNLPK
jgi:hypothetical protein